MNRVSRIEIIDRGGSELEFLAHPGRFASETLSDFAGIACCSLDHARIAVKSSTHSSASAKWFERMVSGLVLTQPGRQIDRSRRATNPLRD